MLGKKSPIKSFRDLEVYQLTYELALIISTKVLPSLPDSERFDLKDQLSRSSKAAPRLIAEGFAKKHQRFGFQKYLDDALAECNETIVSVEMCRDIYKINATLCDGLIDKYDKASRQLYRLGKVWTNFSDARR